MLLELNENAYAFFRRNLGHSHRGVPAFHTCIIAMELILWNLVPTIRLISPMCEPRDESGEKVGYMRSTRAALYVEFRDEVHLIEVKFDGTSVARMFIGLHDVVRRICAERQIPIRPESDTLSVYCCRWIVSGEIYDDKDPTINVRRFS